MHWANILTATAPADCTAQSAVAAAPAVTAAPGLLATPAVFSSISNNEHCWLCSHHKVVFLSMPIGIAGSSAFTGAPGIAATAALAMNPPWGHEGAPSCVQQAA